MVESDANPQVIDLKRVRAFQLLKVAAFRKRLLYPVELWGHSFSALFVLRVIVPFRSGGFLHLPKKSGGKWGENAFLRKIARASNSELVSHRSFKKQTNNFNVGDLHALV